MDGGVLCAGNVLVDILASPVSALQWDATTWIDDLVQSLGGNGANTSYTLATLGTRVRLLGLVADDPFGIYCRSVLAAAGVDLSLLGASNESTACSVVLVRPDGARALLHRPGASREAFAAPLVFDEELTAGCTHFHLANVYGLPLLRQHAGVTLANARSAGLGTSLDTGWDARGEWLPVAAPCFEHLDILFVNRDEARMLAGTSDAAAAARFFQARGVTTVIVKLGGQGCAIFSPGIELHIPAFPVSVVDTTGAGDCFAGGFLAARQRGWDLVKSARFANAVGALSASSLGSTTGVISFEKTEEWIASYSH